MDVLKIKGLRKTYGTGETQVKSLDEIDLTVERGELVANVGSSGSGKTAFLNMVGGMGRPIILVNCSKICIHVAPCTRPVRTVQWER